MAVVNGKLYLAGGHNQFGSPVSALSVFDPATRQWTSLATLLPRYWATAVGLNGLLYVMGGYSGNGPVGWSEVYNPATNTSRTLIDMPTARWSPGSGVINGKVYVVGGQGDVTMTTNEVYTP
jgi:N-acetylneuraminic acid mutarotase